jgi:uncharacterized protein YegP (UPF0339 family)
MITTIILALVAIATSVWALIEKYGKKALNAIIAAMNLDVDKLKGDNMTLQGLLKHEKELRVQEQLKSMDLQKKLAEAIEEKTVVLDTKAVLKTMESMDEPLDIAGLVDGSEQFKLGEDERAVYFEFYKDSRAPKELRWRLKAKNNKILADSGEGYGTKQNLKKALGVMLNAITNKEFKSKWKS